MSEEIKAEQKVPTFIEIISDSIKFNETRARKLTVLKAKMEADPELEDGVKEALMAIRNF